MGKADKLPRSSKNSIASVYADDRKLDLKIIGGTMVSGGETVPHQFKVVDTKA